jgi:hypothetical protein
MIHYVNLGTAKTGTTWLYHNLIKSDQIDYQGEKEPTIYMLSNVDDYKSYFSAYNFSLNFNTNLWSIDYDQIEFIKNYASYITIILRNPYSYANSMYNFHASANEDAEYFQSITQHLDYVGILKRWQSEKLKVLFYDDLENNPQEFVNGITKYVGLTDVLVDHAPRNATAYERNINLDSKSKHQLQYNIKTLEDFLNKDLGHWYNV